MLYWTDKRERFWRKNYYYNRMHIYLLLHCPSINFLICVSHWTLISNLKIIIGSNTHKSFCAVFCSRLVAALTILKRHTSIQEKKTIPPYCHCHLIRLLSLWYAIHFNLDLFSISFSIISDMLLCGIE